MGRADFLNSHIKVNTIKAQDVWLLELNEADRQRATDMDCRSLDEWRSRNKKRESVEN